jgi:hypothetical protein
LVFDADTQKILASRGPSTHVPAIYDFFQFGGVLEDVGSRNKSGHGEEAEAR